MTPLTPLQKAESLCAQMLKKKTESDQLALQMSTMPFGQSLHTELAKFTETFSSGPLFIASFHATQDPLHEDQAAHLRGL